MNKLFKHIENNVFKLISEANGFNPLRSEEIPIHDEIEKIGFELKNISKYPQILYYNHNTSRYDKNKPYSKYSRDIVWNPKTNIITYEIYVKSGSSGNPHFEPAGKKSFNNIKDGLKFIEKFEKNFDDEHN